MGRLIDFVIIVVIIVVIFITVILLLLLKITIIEHIISASLNAKYARKMNN